MWATGDEAPVKLSCNILPLWTATTHPVDPQWCAPAQKIMVLEGFFEYRDGFFNRDSVRKNGSATLVIDMSRVRYMASSGAGVLIGAYVTFEGNCRRLLLVGLNDRVWNLFRTCKIEGVFTRHACP